MTGINAIPPRLDGIDGNWACAMMATFAQRSSRIGPRRVVKPAHRQFSLTRLAPPPTWAKSWDNEKEPKMRSTYQAEE